MHLIEAVSLRDDVASYWLRLARLNMQTRDYPGAYDGYSHAIELEPNNMDALQNLAELSMAAGRLEDAHKHADRVLELDPRNIRGQLVNGYLALPGKALCRGKSLGRQNPRRLSAGGRAAGSQGEGPCGKWVSAGRRSI